MNDLKQKAKELGIIPKKSSGQNFLVDKGVLSRIIECANITSDDNILEIGPGFGILTKQLLDKGAFVLAVEMDSKLANYMRKTFAEYKNLQILEKDILKVSNKEIFNSLGGDFRVVSNIPYQITGKIIKKFLSSELPKPKNALLLVQKEVAERICAMKKDMNLLALSVQLYSDSEICFNVSKDAFWPEPKVNSALLAMSNIQNNSRYNVNEKRFWQVVRIGFSSPRKQLQNNLANGLSVDRNIIKQALVMANIKEIARAQELDVEDWIRLINALD